MDHYTVKQGKTIPEALINTPAWVFWRREERDGRPTKVPYDPKTGLKAEADDPTTWATFEEAAGRGDGVGIFFGDDTPLAGVDLDDCIYSDTGELHPDARQVVDALDSYTEVSPSDTGVKVFLCAVKPGERCRTKDTPWGGEIEIYDSGRFFTVTGNRLEGASATVNNRQKAFKELYRATFGGDASTQGTASVTAPNPPESVTDDEIIGKLEAGRNGDKFRRLFHEGDVSDHAGDESAADMALAGMVVFYTGGDVDGAERIMRQSALYREKYERHDYLPRTIERALYGRGEDDFYVWEQGSQNPSFPSVGVGNLSGKLGRRRIPTVTPLRAGGRPAPRQWIVQNMIPENFPSMIYGGGGKAKTFVAAHIGQCVADPECDRWMNFKIQTAPVLFMDFELGEEEQRRRAYDVAAGRGHDAPPADLHYLDCIGYAPETAFGTAYDACADLGVKLVMIDSVGMALAGDAEKANDTIAFYRDYIAPLQALGATPLLIDHQAKSIKGEKYTDKKAFGSVYKENLARSVLQINGDWHGSELRASLTHTKTNLGPQLENIHLNIAFEEDCVTIERGTDDALNLSTAELVIRDLEENGPATAYTIANRVVGVEVKDVQNRLTEMRGARVEKAGKSGQRDIWRALASQVGSQPNTREPGNLGSSPTLTDDPGSEAA